MCGIGGIWVKRWTGEEHAQLKAINQKLKHRGPDDEGYLVVRDGNSSHYRSEDSVESLELTHYNEDSGSFDWAFTHRRLSIIDLSSASHQPMEIDAFQIVFNGAIYNYPELKAQLEKKGHVFRSEGDTEVLLRAYIEWGEQCLDHLNGMWAFVIYDPRIKSWFGARDITGVKPLYLKDDPNMFAFASEAKVLSDVGESPQMNHMQLIDFLVRGNQESGSETMFRGVEELKPSHAFRFDGEELKVFPYYQPNELLEKNRSCDIDELRSLLNAATARHAIADVSLGTCLSGGIDSSVITGMLASNEGIKDFEVFSSVFPGSNIDESSYAESVVQKWGLSWNRVEPMAEDFHQKLKELHLIQEFPLISSSTFAQYEVMRIAHEKGIKVMLDGQGADELFGGYPQYQFAYYNQLLRKNLVRLPSTITRHKQSFLAFLKNNLRMRILADPASNRRVLMRVYPELKLVKSDLLDEYFNTVEPTQDRSFFTDANEYLASDFFGENLKNLLRYEDRNSMHFGIEARTPFADDRPLIEAVFSLSAADKLAPYPIKSLLRQSARLYLPKKVQERKDKMGFVSPHNEWIASNKGELKQYFNKSSEIFRSDIVTKELDLLFPHAEEAENYRSFRFISARIWEDAFFV